MKLTLIFLATLAVILAIFAYFAVFGSSSGTYAVNPVATDTNIATSTVFILPSSTASSSNPDTGTGTAETSSSEGGSFGTSFTSPALTWPEGQSKISITGVSLEGSQMAFTLSIQTGASPECIPLNLRLVADEEGDLNPPNPASFAFPGSGNCNGAANTVYANQTTTFLVDPTALPLLFTTGGSANIFFEVATTSNNGLNVIFPGTSG